MLRNHLKTELCTGDKKYTLDGLADFIDSCTESHRLSLPFVSLTCVYSPSQPIDIVLIKKVATRINTLLLKFKFQGKPLEYYIVPFKQPRLFPNTGEKFAVRHINGAFTYRNNRKIYIFRYEEWPKVAIHEACHHLPIHTENWNPSALSRLHEVFLIDKTGCPYNCTTNILPNEAVIEFWAELFHIGFVADEYAVPFKVLLQKEIEHALGKTAKILMHQRKYFPTWQEDTHAFSYVVLRTVLLFFHDAFKRIPYPYDSKTVTEFLISKFRDPRFQSALKKANAPRGNDMRMTYFGDF